METIVPLWREIQRKNFTKLDLLLDFLEISKENREKILSKPRFALNIPFRLASKIEKNSLRDPLFRQFVPLIEEEVMTPGFMVDPVGDKVAQKTKKILHKYKGRALLVTTSACAMHCRYCFRQNFPYEAEEKKFDEDLAYIQQDTSLKEIILSGGDPLSLSDKALKELFSSFESIKHLKRIRFHTRFPIGIPERITDSFLEILKSSSKQIFFIVHINHPNELDADILGSLKKIQCLGIPVLNQAVLLKGVNDDKTTLLNLCEALVNAGILPYYLNSLDRVQGSGHFELTENYGLELIRYVQENLSGYGVPRLIREEAGKPSKTILR